MKIIVLGPCIVRGYSIPRMEVACLGILNIFNFGTYFVDSVWIMINVIVVNYTYA